MTMKSDKGKKTEGHEHKPSSGNADKKASSKPKKQEEEDAEDLEEDEEMDVKATKKGAKPAAVKKSGDDDDDDDAGEDEPDEWEKPEEEEEWDPDFDEFDIPTSKNKKSTGTVAGGKKGKEEEDDFKVDEEFKDLYDDGMTMMKRKITKQLLFPVLYFERNQY